MIAMASLNTRFTTTPNSSPMVKIVIVRPMPPAVRSRPNAKDCQLHDDTEPIVYAYGMLTWI